ncbi:MAG: hypothetical protein AAF353_00005 [Pseudomonadota bacterium]
MSKRIFHFLLFIFLLIPAVAKAESATVFVPSGAGSTFFDIEFFKISPNGNTVVFWAQKEENQGYSLFINGTYSDTDATKVFVNAGLVDASPQGVSFDETSSFLFVHGSFNIDDEIRGGIFSLHLKSMLETHVSESLPVSDTAPSVYSSLISPQGSFALVTVSTSGLPDSLHLVSLGAADTINISSLIGASNPYLFQSKFSEDENFLLVRLIFPNQIGGILFRIDLKTMEFLTLKLKGSKEDFYIHQFEITQLGKSIVAFANPYNSHSYNIYFADLNQFEATLLVSPEETPTIEPPAFSTSDYGTVKTITPPPPPDVVFPSLPANCFGGVIVGSEIIYNHMIVSPDGSWLVYTMDTESKDSINVYALDLTNKVTRKIDGLSNTEGFSWIRKILISKNSDSVVFSGLNKNTGYRQYYYTTLNEPNSRLILDSSTSPYSIRSNYQVDERFQYIVFVGPNPDSNLEELHKISIRTSEISVLNKPLRELTKVEWLSFKVAGGNVFYTAWHQEDEERALHKVSIEDEYFTILNNVDPSRPFSGECKFDVDKSGNTLVVKGLTESSKLANIGQSQEVEQLIAVSFANQDLCFPLVTKTSHQTTSIICF